MYFKRSTKGFFSPICNRQNINISNCPIQSPDKPTHQKQSYQTNDKTNKSFKKEQNKLELGYLTENYQCSHITYCVQSYVKEDAVNENDDDKQKYQSCQKLRRKSKKSTLLDSIKIQPKCLDFTVISIQNQNQKGQIINVKLIQSIHQNLNNEDLFYDSQNEDSQFYYKIRQYDNDSDKQNRPPSDNQNQNYQYQYDSSYYNSDDQYEYQDTEQQQKQEQQQLTNIKRISIQSLKRKYLEDIQQVDECSKLTAIGK